MLKIKSSGQNLSLIVLILLIAVIWITRFLTPADNTLTWDVFGYYLWLPAKFIHHDIWLSHIDWVKQLMNEYKISGTLYQAYVGPNGTWMYWFLFGMGYLYMPFFFIGHLYAKCAGYEMNGFSAPYQYAIAYGSVIYCIIGLCVLWKILKLYFKEVTIAIVLTAIVLGTNYFQVSAINGAMTSGYLFTVLALLVWFTIKWHEKQRLIYAVIIAGIVTVTALAKPSEVVCILIPLLWDCGSIHSIKEKFKKVKRKWWQILIMFLLAGIILFPQLFYWKQEAGKWIYDSYNNPGVGLDLLSPHIGKILFSFRKGWFVYTPIIIFFLIGFYNMRKRNKELVVPIGIYFIVTFYIISSWTEWWYGGGYGQRTLITSYAILAIPLGYFVEDIWKRKVWKIILVVAFLLLIALNLFQTWQYNHYILHPDRMSMKYYFRIFGKTTIIPEDRFLLLTERSYGYDDYFPGTEFYNVRNIGLYDFEEGTYPGFEKFYSSDTAHSGLHAFRMDSTIEFSPEIKTTYNGITSRDHAWIRASVWMYFKDSIKDESPLLVVTSMHDGNNYKYKTLGINKKDIKTGQWQKVEIYYQTPEVRSITDEIVIYVWNIKKQKCLIDDLRADAYTVKY